MKNIVCISGTSRPGNYTSKAMAIVRDELERRGIETTVFDARELTLAFPGQPATDDAKRLQEAVRNATAVVFGTPEYHGGLAAMAKLFIENMGSPSTLKGKPVAMVGVAAGRIGAIKSLEQLRGICSHTGAVVLPGSVSVAGVQVAFDKDGTCLDEGVEASLRGLADSLLEFVENYICPKHTLEDQVRSEAKTWTASV